MRRQRHDPFLKRLYRAGARDAIGLFFPDLAARIDWANLQWIDKETPIAPPLQGEEHRSIVADLVGLTRDVEGRYLEVLIHPEIQMRVPADIGWRVLQYNAGHTLQQGTPEARVLTFVFYHCAGAEGIRKQRFALEFYEDSVLEVGYWSIGLGELDAAQFAESDNPMAWALTAWMRQSRVGRAALRLGLMDRILRRVSDESYRRLLFDAVRSYFRLNRAEQADEQRLLAASEHGEVSEMIETELDRLEDRAWRAGAREAEQRARQEARQAEQRTLQDALLEVVRARFPEAPANLEARIRQVHRVRSLQALIRRAAIAGSLEEVGPLPEA